jgi:hypothetical protein
MQKPMKRSFNNINIGYSGALISTAAIFAYALVVMVYVVTRSSNFIFSAMPTDERAGIMVANGFAVAYSVTVFSILMAIPSSVVGSVSAILIKWFLQRFNGKSNAQRAMVISGTVALCVLAVIYFVLRILLKDWMTLHYPETLLFWFVVPALICFVVCLVGGSKLNRELGRID